VPSTNEDIKNDSTFILSHPLRMPLNDEDPLVADSGAINIGPRKQRKNKIRATAYFSTEQQSVFSTQLGSFWLAAPQTLAV